MSNAQSNHSYGAFWSILGLLAFIVAGFLMAMNHDDNSPARVIRNDGYTKMYSSTYNPFKTAKVAATPDTAAHHAEEHAAEGHAADAHAPHAKDAQKPEKGAANPANEAPKKKADTHKAGGGH